MKEKMELEKQCKLYYVCLGVFFSSCCRSMVKKS